MTLTAPNSVSDTTRDPGWVPLRITAHLTDHIVTDVDPMHLDGPVSWCAYMEHQSRTKPLPPMTPAWAVDFDLGMATWTAPPSGPVADPRLHAADGTSIWGWACSAAWAPALLRSLTHTRRPAQIRETAKYTTVKTVHTGAGPHKARNVPHSAVWAPQVTWWCLGDPERLRTLTTRLRGLGRLTRHGHGTVIHTEVVEDQLAAQRWMWREWPHQSSPHIGACRAPYHHPSRRMPCAPPGQPPWGLD